MYLHCLGFAGSAPVNGFAEIHFMTLKHLEELAWLTASRAETVTVFMCKCYVEKTCLAVKVTFQDVCYLETFNNHSCLFFLVHSFPGLSLFVKWL